MNVDPRLMRLATAKSLLGLGRYDEAVTRLEGLLEIERTIGNRAGDLCPRDFLLHSVLRNSMSASLSAVGKSTPYS